MEAMHAARGRYLVALGTLPHAVSPMVGRCATARERAALTLPEAVGK